MRISHYSPDVEQNFISIFWPNVPNGLEAAYEAAERDEIRFFKGNVSAMVPFRGLMFHLLWG